MGDMDEADKEKEKGNTEYQTLLGGIFSLLINALVIKFMLSRIL